MKRLGLILFLLGLAAPLRAETVNVLSGDHRGFSRLAMVTDPPRGWRLGRDGDAYVLRLEGAGVEIDAARVFSRIGRKRIGGVSSPRPGELRIELACECRANAFEERPGLLVIDILDGKPQPGSRFEAPLPPLLMAPEPVARDDNAIYWRNLLGDRAPAAGTGLEPNIALTLAREELLSRLARAAAQGVVEMDAPAEAETAALGSPLLRVQTVMDRDLGALRRDEPPPATVCIGDERVEISSWAETRPFAEQIGPARTALVGEFDRPSTEAVTRLVRLYLHYGMGVEAAAVMRAFPDAVEDGPLLSALAAIVEGVPETAPRGILTGQVTCDGAVAIWALLADPAPGLLREIARDAILRSLPGLPPDLRRQVGPELSRRLLERGDRAAAQEVTAAMARVRTEGPGAGEVLAQGRLDEAAGQAPRPALERLAEAAAPESPEALLMLIDRRLAQEQPVDPDLATAAATLAFEMRNHPLAPRLTRAQILALGSSGAFDAAYAVLDDLPAADVPAGLAAELMMQLARMGSDEGFLRRALRADALSADAPPEVVTATATRLLDLGFAAEARDLLGRPGGTPDPVLTARAALTDGDAQGALRILAGLPGPEAERLRARGLDALGEFAGAAGAWQAAGDAAAAARSSWRAGDWSAVGAEGLPEEKAVALRMLPADSGPGSGAAASVPASAGAPPAAARTTGPEGSPIASPSAADGPGGAVVPLASGGVLARNRALVAETQSLRSELDALLRVHPSPDN